jgi:cytoskeleton protein RodZ
LASFGAKLKQEREKRKITLDDISSSTKIGSRMLQALEEDKFNQLPGGIFNKGFVRSYARFVGLDEDQIVADYMQASGDAPPPNTEIAAREDEARENEENVRRLEGSADSNARQLRWGLFAAILLVVALALFFWSRQREHRKQSLRTSDTTTSANASGELGNSSAVTTSSLTNSTVSPQPNLIPATTPANSGSTTSVAAKTSSQKADPPRSTPNPVSASPTQAVLPPAAPGEFTVVVHAREESWISISADGKHISSEVLPPGTERVVRGRKEVTVKAGNAGAVDLQFDGKKLSTGGEYGEVKTVTFGPHGLLPSASPPQSNP